MAEVAGQLGVVCFCLQWPWAWLWGAARSCPKAPVHGGLPANGNEVMRLWPGAAVVVFQGCGWV